MANTLKVVGLDPGTANFGYCTTKFTSEGNFYPLRAGKLESRVTDMSDLPDQIGRYLAETQKVVVEQKPDILVVERFMNRGKFSGDTGEYVSMMLALVVHQTRSFVPKCRIHIVQPGVWKTAFNRSLGRKNGDKKPTQLDKAYKFCLTEPHELDAYLMTHFAAAEWLGCSPFEYIPQCGRRSFVEELEAVATGKKKRKRINI
jgi:hypothetical protein